MRSLVAMYLKSCKKGQTGLKSDKELPFSLPCRLRGHSVNEDKELLSI